MRYQPLNIGDQRLPFRLGRVSAKLRRVEAVTYISHVFVTQRSQIRAYIQPRSMLRQELAAMGPGIRKKDVEDKVDGRCRAFDV